MYIYIYIHCMLAFLLIATAMLHARDRYGPWAPEQFFDQTYGCESKCKVWIMLRAHMCSRPTIQTPDPDPFRGNDPDVMIQTEMMNNSIDVRTPCGIVQKAISHVQCHTFLYLDVSSTDLKINYKAALHGSR